MTAPPADQDGADNSKKSEPLVPFRPTNSHVAKRINPIPYVHDPLEPKLQMEHDKRVEASKKLAASGPWRPSMGSKSDMVRSVVKMNIPR